MKFFYWSVDPSPKKDPALQLSLEAVGLLHRLRRELALKKEPSGVLNFDGNGDNDDAVALLLRVPTEKFKKLTAELEEWGEIIREGGCWKLIKWHSEQKRYFEHLEYMREKGRQARKHKKRKRNIKP